MDAKRRGLLAAATIFVVVAGAWLWVSTPGAQAQPVGNVIHASFPEPGSSIEPGMVIRGSINEQGLVYVWVKGVNFAVPAQMGTGTFAYKYGGGLSGERTLVFGLRVDDKWVGHTEATYQFGGATSLPVGAGPSVVESLPSTARTIFRPVDEVSRAVVVTINHGLHRSLDGLARFGSGDLDNNGVPDRLQGKAGQPGSGWLGEIPVSYIAIGVVLLIGGPAIVFAVWGDKILESMRERREESGRRAVVRQQGKERRNVAQAKFELDKAREVAKLQALQLREQAHLKAKAISFEEKKLAAVKDLKSKQLDLMGKRGA